MVDINRVYETVLDAHNKENRGFVVPSAFNNYATQAQIEIFESYFNGQYRASLNPMSAGDYNDTTRNLEEKITVFDNTATATKGTYTNPDTTVTSNYYAYPAGFYRLGVVTAAGVILDEVSHAELPYINKAPLTAPTVKQPIYTRHEGGITAYPPALGDVTMVYVREPSLPSWAGGTAGGQLIALAANLRTAIPGTTTYYRNFDVHPSEEPLLVAKILGYAGLETRSQEVIQVAAGKDQQLIQQTQ